MTTSSRPERHEIVLDDRVVEVLTAGERGGSGLVFHHGTPTAAIVFPEMAAAAAARGLWLICASRPGYSSSSPQRGRTVLDNAAITAGVCDSLGIDEFVSLGWSGGGPHALSDAAALGGRCRAVATIAGVAPYGADGLDWLAGMGEDNQVEFAAALGGEETLAPFIESTTPLLAAAEGADLSEALGSLLSDVDKAMLTGELADLVAEAIRRGALGGGAGWRDDDIAFTTKWGFEVGDVVVPASVWQGTDDLMVPEAHGRWLAAHLQDVSPHVIDHEGHFSLGRHLEAIVGELASRGELGTG